MALPEQRKQTNEEIGAHAAKFVTAVCRKCGAEFQQNAVAPCMSCPDCMHILWLAFWATMEKN